MEILTAEVIFRNIGNNEVIFRYIGNSSQQMGLEVEGVSLVDSGEWVLRILFGLRWVAVPFEVLIIMIWMMDDDLFDVGRRCLLTTEPPSHRV